ncbi:unnamed protein product [Nesidiocoris tenuis]|uniref:Uncharacterized protein n=1 Tax=Nesidiocoris tenuis TaxID=355587 RepID=A0A6H5GS39_9HEMI|nr:unnamed protein product [Nesidiocoris tenuis]
MDLDTSSRSKYIRLPHGEKNGHGNVAWKRQYNSLGSTPTPPRPITATHSLNVDEWCLYSEILILNSSFPQNELLRQSGNDVMHPRNPLSVGVPIQLHSSCTTYSLRMALILLIQLCASEYLKSIINISIFGLSWLILALHATRFDDLRSCATASVMTERLTSFQDRARFTRWIQ